MTPAVERQYAMICPSTVTSRLKGKKWVQLEREREYVQLRVEAS